MTAARLGAEIAAAHGPRDEREISFAARDPDGRWLGGLNAVMHWRWLYIRQFYVSPEQRGGGLGCALLAAAEALARAENGVGVYLDTFELAAEAFYRRRGFTLKGRIENFPPGASRAFLSKALL